MYCSNEQYCILYEPTFVNVISEIWFQSKLNLELRPVEEDIVESD